MGISVQRRTAAYLYVAQPVGKDTLPCSYFPSSQSKDLFSRLGTFVEVLGIKGSTVHLGIEAPPEILIEREEVADRAAEWVDTPAAVSRTAFSPRSADWPKHLCDRLQNTGMGLGLVQLLLDAGQIEEARTALVSVRKDDVSQIRHTVAGDTELSLGETANDSNRQELMAGFPN